MRPMGNSRTSPGISPLVPISLLFSALSLALGILFGMISLASDAGQSISSQAVDVITIHPDLMVFGALGGLLITEKIGIMENFLIFRSIRISRIIVPGLFSGVYLASLGIFFDNGTARYLGLALIITAAVFFGYFMTSGRNPGQGGIKWIFGAAISCIALSAFANAFALIWMNVELTYLALLFPVIYVLAERMELGFVRGMSTEAIRIQAILAWAIVILSFISVEGRNSIATFLSLYASVLLLITVILYSMVYDPAFHGRKRKGRFQSYMRAGVVTAYAWLFLGLSLFMVQFWFPYDILDPAAHAIALGFIGTFIVAHSPIIFPLVLNKEARQDRVSFAPLILINVATFLRIVGDLYPQANSVGAVIAYASGYVILVTIIAVVINLKRITTNHERGNTPEPA